MTAPSAPAPEGWRLWLAGARPRTLPAAVVPVLVGTAAAAALPGSARVPAGDPSLLADLWYGLDPDGPLRGISLWRFLAAMVVALAIQVATNYANDHSDGVKGTDTADRVGPVRLVGSGLASAGAVKRAAIAAFAVAGVAGLLLAAAVSWWLLLVGAVSFAAGWLYTGGPRPYGYAGLGEVFVFVFFGVVATAGSTYVQLEELTGLALAASVPVGLLATALLVINNLRDIPTDAAVGKNTLAVRLGDQRTRYLYAACMVLPFVTVPLISGLSGRPLGSVSLLAVILARRPLQAVLEGARGPALIPVLGQTGRVQLVFGVLFALGLFLAAG
jgi:1,4-dihydroxy-2-naphthoate octaprenyltransferase